MNEASGGNRFPPLKTPEDRAIYVSEHFIQCGKNIAPQVIKLRADFRALKPGEEIMGCKTWTEFCKKVLKLTVRAVRYIIAGGNPRSKRSKESANGGGGDTGANEWGGMPEFNQPDATSFRRLIVHFKDQEAVDTFAKLVNQKITPKTRFIWYPAAERVSVKNVRWVDIDSDEMKDEGASWG